MIQGYRQIQHRDGERHTERQRESLNHDLRSLLSLLTVLCSQCRLAGSSTEPAPATLHPHQCTIPWPCGLIINVGAVVTARLSGNDQLEGLYKATTSLHVHKNTDEHKKDWAGADRKNQ